MGRIIFWAQRLENDGNDYVYLSADCLALKTVDSFDEKSKLIYDSSKLLDRKYEKTCINLKKNENNVKIYYDAIPITKLYISLTISKDEVGRESPAFIYFEDEKGIDIKIIEENLLMLINQFTEELNREKDEKTIINIRQAINELVKRINNKKKTIILLVLGTAISLGLLIYAVKINQ